MFRNEKLINLGKIIISLAILGYLLTKIDWMKSYEAIKNANVIYLIITLVISFLNRIVINYKQYVLLKVRNIKLSFWKLFNINMIGAFWGMFLPSSLSTDVVRGFYLLKTDADKSITISSVVVDRFLGVFSLLFLALIGLIFSSELIPDKNIKLFIIFFTAALIVALFIFQLKSTSRFIEKGLKFIKYKSIGGKIIKLQKAFLDYKMYPLALLVSFILSVVVQFIRVLDIFLIGLAFGVQIPFFYLIILVPIIMILVMVPISVGGIGVREGAYVGFLNLIGISPSISIVIALTSTLLTTVIAMYGGVAYMFFKTDNPVLLKNNTD